MKFFKDTVLGISTQKILSGSLLLLVCLLFSNVASAQTAKEQACFNDVQGTVAWNQQGNTTWNPENIKNLCKGVNQPEKRISCFEKGIAAHGKWDRAINDCKNAGTKISTKKIAGKQCVYNKAGYALNVDWYDPGRVVFTGGNLSDYSNYKVIGDPHKTDAISLGYSSCTDIANRVAVARIIGHDVANAAITISAGVAVGASVGAVGAFACVGTAGAGCPAAVAATSVLVSGAVSATALALPKTEEIAYIGTPGTNNYLDMFGTVWEPAISNTVSLSETRKPIKEGFDHLGNAIARWVDGGKPGAHSITYRNRGGFNAWMQVVYYKNTLIGKQFVPVATVVKSDEIIIGQSRHINLPQNVANIPMQVTITGRATTKNPVFLTTLPGNFKGNKCFKSEGTFLTAGGGSC